jgi:hypothetical protein
MGSSFGQRPSAVPAHALKSFIRIPFGRVAARSYLNMKSSSFKLGILATVALLPATSHAQNRLISTDLTNIAAAQNGGRVLSVTSTLDNDKAYSVANLIDGQSYNFQKGTGSKGWASNQYDPVNMDAVTLAFAGNTIRKIGKLVINPGVDLTPERWAKDIEVQVSTTSAEGPYTAVAQLTLKREAVPQEFNILPVNARFVRLMFRTNFGSDRSVGLGEVEIYEAIDGSDPMGSLITRLESAIADLRRYQDVQGEGAAAPRAAAPRPAARRGAAAMRATIQDAQLVTGDVSAFPTANLNIASARNGGKIMDSSSTYNKDEEFGPEKLIDGQNFRPADGKGSSGWASEGFAPGKEFVTIGFAEDRVKLIGKLVINPVSNQSDLRWARRIEVQVTSGSYKDGPWKTAASINLRPEPVNQDFTIRPVEAKYVRFVFQANGPGVILPNADPNVNSDRAVSLGEIEVYEAVAGNDQLNSLIGRFNQVLADFKTLRRRQISEAAAADDAPAPAQTSTTPAPRPQAAPVATAPRSVTPAKAATKPVKAAPAPAKKNLQEARVDENRTNSNG